jgi:hypothetical protein
MSSRSPLRARLSFLLSASLIVSMLVASGAGAATASQELWRSAFGEGTSAAFRSIGDGAPSTVWNGRQNVSFGPHAGQDAMNVSLPKDVRDGIKLQARFQDLGFENRRTIRMDYDVFVPNAEAMTLDLKLPGFGSAPANQNLWYVSSGGVKHADSASIRLHTRPAGGWGIPHPYLEAYVYAERGGGQVRGDWGMYWRFSERMNAMGSRKGDEYAIPIGEWFTISIEAEMNTPGNADGALRMWLNGKQGIDIDDMVYVTAAPYEWTQTVFSNFYNTGSHPATTIRLANMRFGTLGSPTTPTTPTVTPEPTPEPIAAPSPEPTPEPIAAPSPTPEPAPAPALPALTVNVPQLQTSASGTTASGAFTVETNRSVTFSRIGIAVRDAQGGMHDFAVHRDATVDTTRTFTGTRTGLPIGVYTARVVYQLDGEWTHTGPTRTFIIGPTAAQAIPVTGDFDGDGREQQGWFHDGWWFLPIGPDRATVVFAYGQPGDRPVTGDWNGNGRDGIGIVRGTSWQLRQTPTAGTSQVSFTYGRTTDLPVVGDWNGNLQDGIGVFRDGRWLLRQTASSGKEQIAVTFGQAGDRPLPGRWTAGKADGLGVVRGDTWLLRTTPTGGSAQQTYRFGLATDRPVVGDWNRNGQQTAGVVRGEQWLLSNSLPARTTDVTVTYAPTSTHPA